MSSKYSPSGTSSFSLTLYGAKRLPKREAPRRRRSDPNTWERSDFLQLWKKSMPRQKKVVEAKQDANDPSHYCVEDDVVTPHAVSQPEYDNATASPQANRFTETPPSSNTPPVAPESNMRNYSFGVRPLFGVVVAMDGKSLVYIQAYVHVKAVKALAVTLLVLLSGVLKSEEIENTISFLLKQLLS